MAIIVPYFGFDNHLNPLCMRVYTYIAACAGIPLAKSGRMRHGGRPTRQY